MSPRESVDEKARRYLGEGRGTVDYADTYTVRATARASDAVYRVGFGGGACANDCPAWGHCAHGGSPA